MTKLITAAFVACLVATPVFAASQRCDDAQTFTQTSEKAIVALCGERYVTFPTCTSQTQEAARKIADASMSNLFANCTRAELIQAIKDDQH
jgi:hypothetical protein